MLPLPKDAPGAVEVPGSVRAGRPPTAGKFVYYELANLPIVVNPLTDSEFSPWDQREMAQWNRYAGDLYRVSAAPTSNWAYGNGVSDIVGFPSDGQMQAQFGGGWGDFGQGVLAVSFVRRVDGIVQEADVAFSPTESWTLDDVEGINRGTVYPFKDVALHELGHVWGLKHPWQTQQVWWDSVMNYKSKRYYLVELFADDTEAVRAAFPKGVALRDGLISSYVTDWQEIDDSAEYYPALPSVESVRAGGSFNITGPIKIENTGTVKLANPAVEVYLVPQRLSLDGAVLIKRLKVRGTVPVGGTMRVNVGSIRVPPKAREGTYFLAFYLRDPKDAYQGNNAAWSNEDVTLTVIGR